LVFFMDIWYTYGHLVHFMDIWYILWSFGINFPVLVCCIKKNPGNPADTLFKKCFASKWVK
jgi:hypothetical protein